MPAPSELSEQIKLCHFLSRAGVVFFHVPNGGKRGRREAIALKAAGLKAGVPDLIIPQPPSDGGYVGAVVEMKRSDGRPCDVREEQRDWLAIFRRFGWLTLVGFGADDAREKLTKGGYQL